MEIPLTGCNSDTPIRNRVSEIAAANNPMIRLLRLPLLPALANRAAIAEDLWRRDATVAAQKRDDDALLALVNPYRTTVPRRRGLPSLRRARTTGCAVRTGTSIVEQHGSWCWKCSRSSASK